MKMELNVKAAAVFISAVLMTAAACKKNPTAIKPDGSYPLITDSVYKPIDPSLPATVGFFQDAWSARNFSTPDTVAGTVTSLVATDSLPIDVNKVVAKVPPYVFGNNSNLWMGQIVTQPS